MARLGVLERRVMDVLWGCEGTELTVREVAGALPSHAYTTVLTVLNRLEHKQMVRRSTADEPIATRPPPAVSPIPPS